MSLPSPPPVSVSELNRKAKSLLENQLGEVCVEAEIGDLSKPSSGHWYFTLKDARAQLRCAMFRRANVRVRFQPKLGDSVVVRGLLSIYEARGDYQLIVDDMQASGDGALQRELEALKQRLQAEGLFASDRKLPVPIHCERIGVITSPTGAAIEDIISVLGRRSPSSEIALFPVPVQGSGAAQQIADAIDKANTLVAENIRTIDVLIVGRGGGSLEDLWSFNEEVVARAIARSNIPIVSAVGHEIDYSIADLVADVRAATPSQAAELVTRDTEEWLQHIDSQAAQLNMLVQRKLAAQQASLAHLKARLRHPRHRLNLIREQLKSARDRAALLIQQRLTRERQIVNQIRRDLRAVSPTMITRKQKDTVARLHQQLPSLIAAVLNRQTDRVMHLTQLLTSLGPASTLERGYAIVTSVNEGVVRDSKTVSVDSEITIRLHRGGLTSVVTETHDEPKPA
ncbi:MAG: exodeoxyribonuclease VII large subunit [Alteromonadaceae bacterium TMED101]|nr:MAG: exodeoxyribonuclease VII large subunit [Alteromonadaceae bacterium TMED101]